LAPAPTARNVWRDGVALITFILLAVEKSHRSGSVASVDLRMRIVMLIASAAAYFINAFIAKSKYGNADEMNYEAPLTSLVWITSFVSIALTYVISSMIIPTLGGDASQWWKLATDYFLRHAGWRHHPRIGKGLHINRIAPR